MKKRIIDRAAIKRATQRSTCDSAALEDRVVPPGFERSDQAEKYLAECRERASNHASSVRPAPQLLRRLYPGSGAVSFANLD
ncbi:MULTISPECIES: hypothetical protein [Leucobacter]|uniref:hypothetical protein n=1 Tax=Leucobacter TaxID=55968 RepID=UPI000F6434B4|nr:MULTISPECIES: hypothetical protein [Leucobacter]